MRDAAKQSFMDGTVIPALPLVLDENRQFDEAGQRRLVRYYLEAGAGGLAVAVHTTQFEIRDAKTRLFEKVTTVAKEEIESFEARTGKCLVTVCGVCGETDAACDEASFAKKLGYDAVLLSPGGLPHYTEDMHLQRAAAVSDIISVIGFYLQSSVGGRTFTYSYWEQLCKLPGLIGIKAAPFNRYATIDVARAIQQSGRADSIALYTGNDDNIVIDLLTAFTFNEDTSLPPVYCRGGLLGHWAVWTHTAVSLLEKLKKARAEKNIPHELLTLAAQVSDTNAAFFDTANQFKGCIAGIHEVLRRQGLMQNIYTLNPDEQLSPGQAEEIDRIYSSYPHLNDDAFVQEFLEKEAARAK